MKKIKVIFTLTALLIVLLSSSYAENRDISWGETEQLTTSSLGGYRGNVIEDYNGDIHSVFSHRDPSNGDSRVMMRTKNEGSGWNDEILISKVDVTAGWSKLFKSPEGKIHILYFEYNAEVGNYNLKRRIFDPSTGTLSDSDIIYSDEIGCRAYAISAMYFISENEYFVAWDKDNRFDPEKAFVTKWNGTEWEDEFEFHPDSKAFKPAFVNYNDRIFIFFTTLASEELEYVEYDEANNEWSDPITVPTASSVYNFSAKEYNGELYVLNNNYEIWGDQPLYMQKFDGTTWTYIDYLNIFLDEPSPYANIGLEIVEDKFQIFYRNTNQTIKHYTVDPVTQSSELVTTIGEEANNTYINHIVDSNHRIHFIYGDSKSGVSQIYYVMASSSLTEINNNGEWLMMNGKLKQNYPNPFNPTTDINYDLRNVNYELAEIVVHNSVGQKIWSSPVTRYGSRVTGSILFDGSKLNSGLYYYSLVIDGKKIDSKSMILIK